MAVLLPSEAFGFLERTFENWRLSPREIYKFRMTKPISPNLKIHDKLTER
jgi:hypothetical protein